MTDTVRDAIAASLASITRIMPAPVEPFAYGSDVSCDTDVDPGVAELAGDDRMLIAQAVVRRLDTPRGTLPDDASYGISVTSMLSAGISTQEVAQLAGVIRAEVSKDDRISSTRVTVTPSSALDALTIDVYILPVDPALGPFTMTLAVTSGAILLEAIA